MEGETGSKADRAFGPKLEVNRRNEKLKLLAGACSTPGKATKSKKALDNDLPQDMRPASRHADEVSSFIGIISDGGREESPWVSPNKSGEMNSNGSPQESNTTSGPKSTPPTDESDQSALEESVEEDSASGPEYNYSYHDEEDLESPAKKTPSFSIVGTRLGLGAPSKFKMADVPPLDFTNISDPTVLGTLDPSSKDWIKIVHNGKEIMMVLPSEKSSELGSTFEMSETIAASFGIREEIVALRTQVLFQNHESIFHQHGNVVLPISTVVSGQLKQIIEDAENEDVIPCFGIVTKSAMFDRATAQDLQTLDAPSQGEESEPIQTEELPSQDEASLSSRDQEATLYTEEFIQLMQTSDEFSPEEKNLLLRFGIDNVDSGNRLFRASFRIAVFTGNMDDFAKGLKSIAAILQHPRSSRTDVKMLEFVLLADELYESDDLTPLQYVTFLNAVFEGDSDVERLFEQWSSVEFVDAYGSGNLREDFLVHDIYKLAKVLPPIKPRSIDDLLKNAIRLGLNNLATSIPNLSQEFVNIIYHMFSSGDELVLSACRQFVETNDADVVENMLLREWKIYCKNRPTDIDLHETEEEATDTKHLETQDSSSEKESDTKPLQTHDSSSEKESETYLDVPDILLTAVAALVDIGDIKRSDATAIISSYQKGNTFLHEVYRHYLDFGDVPLFFSLLKKSLTTNLTAQEVGHY